MASWQEGLSQAWKNDISFLQLVSDLSGMAIALWVSGDGETGARWASCPCEVHPCFASPALRTTLEEHCRGGMPSIYLENNLVFYGVMPIGAFALAIGPATFLSVPGDSIRTDSAGLQPVARADLDTVARYMKLIYHHFMGTAVCCEEIPVTAEMLENWQPAGALEEYQLDQSEHDRDHRSGRHYEKELLRAVEQGDTDLLKELMNRPAPRFDQIGALSEAKSKENEYLAVSLITLVTRAAVAGGAPAETAHELGDVYLKRLGKAVLRGESPTFLSFSAILAFTEMVRRARAEKSERSCVEACKAYIEKHLRHSLEVSEIAPAIGISRSYLSRVFHQTEGITIQQYIQRERCNHAARMLLYSNYPISQIAQYFGFSSQSYFGVCFQNWYGVSPSAYRRAGQQNSAHT